MSGKGQIDSAAGEREELELTSLRMERARSKELLDGWRAKAQEQERELAAAEAKLVEAELRAERAEDALTSIRGGRAYRLMRILWRLRRPFAKRD